MTPEEQLKQAVELAWMNYSMTSFGTNTISEADFKNIFIMGFKAAQEETNSD